MFDLNINWSYLHDCMYCVGDTWLDNCRNEHWYRCSCYSGQWVYIKPHLRPWKPIGSRCVGFHLPVLWRVNSAEEHCLNSELKTSRGNAAISSGLRGNIVFWVGHQTGLTPQFQDLTTCVRSCERYSTNIYKDQNVLSSNKEVDNF